MTLRQIISPIRKPVAAAAILLSSIVGAIVLTNVSPASLGIGAAKTSNQQMAGATVNKQAAVQNSALANTNAIEGSAVPTPSGSGYSLALGK